MLVILGEILKLSTTFVRTGCETPTMDITSLRQSLRFLIPSILYTVNNNIYFIGLTFVTPPIWIILCSFRTALTALVYRFYLKQNISKLQFAGVLCIVSSIIVAKVDDVLITSMNSVPLIVIVMAAVASCNSVLAAVYTEFLFKTTVESFLDQQFWLYLYGVLVSSFVHVIFN